MKVFGLVGWSDSGKTTLMTRLLPELTNRGLRVSTAKHAHHEFDLDTEGKDSYLHRSSGATEVMIASRQRWALLHEHRNEPESSLEELITHMSPVDLLMVEGMKQHAHDKIEVHRSGRAAPLILDEQTGVVAVASDAPLEGLSVPVLDLNDPSAIADFIIDHCGLARLVDAARQSSGG
ncbi:MAG TPA: molybdopterin-guanine dinucleotide biosynthesis protein B [Sneathiellales bacterium]|jgi:molybdopterin-guanine dinucleotide biosynthesis protein B|nr:molybdopterin-guanine dinucleotide biosynthesis protein B [Sneathiellales bacterium]